MIYFSVLATHIAATALTVGALVFALLVLYRNIKTQYSWSALLLGSIAAFQVLSGTLLTVLSPELSAASLLLHVVSYLGVCFIVETLLFIRMQKVSLAFPLLRVASPVLMSACTFLITLSYGL